MDDVGVSGVLAVVPSWSTVLTTWRTTWAVELVVTALAALYLRTAVTVGGWPARWTVSALLALAVVVVTVDSGIGVLAPRSFAVGVVMQLLLMVVAPALWVAGRPVALLRRGCSARTAAALDRIRDATAVRVATSPPAVVLVYALVLGLTLLTASSVATATSPVPQVLGPLVRAAAGLLLLHTALGRGGPAARAAVLLLATVVTVAAGLVVASAPAVLGPVLPPDDVRRGGVLLGAAGGGLLLAITALVGGRWLASRAAERRRPRSPTVWSSGP